jgi:Protein of unknown function (DUF1761)
MIGGGIMLIVRHLAALPAAVAFWILGAAWYSLLSAPWLTGIGKTADQVPQGTPLPYVVGFFAILAMCYTLSWLIDRLDIRTLASGAGLGAIVALGFCGAMVALDYGFEGRSVMLWLIDTGYALVGLTLAGAIIGAWPKRKKT